MLFTKKTINSAIFFFFVSVIFCSCQEVSKFETALSPWNSHVKEKTVHTEYLTSYMNSRPPRIVSIFNRDWTFNFNPSSKEQVKFIKEGYDDGLWDAVALPHTWQTYETTGDLHPYIKNASESDDPYWWEGWGYYRKHFILKDKFQGKKIILEFDGIQKYCKVYLNEELIGDHKGGYTSFYLDISDKIKWNEDNILAITVNNNRRDSLRIPPMYAGNWNTSGGIYRDIRLVMKNKLFVPYQGSYEHEGGTFITTPGISKDKSDVNVTTYVKNEYEKIKSCQLITRIYSPEGKVIREMESSKDIPSGDITTFQQLFKDFENPVLWSPENAILYKVTTEIISNGFTEDRYESPLGFRWFRWDQETDELYVNGDKINIEGINRQQDYPWLCDAIPKWITLNDLKDIKFGLGHNFLRPHMNPNDPYFFDLTDQFGLIVNEAVPNAKLIDFNEKVQEQNLRELIRRDRNHPSIFFWNVGCETTDAADSKWVLEEDTTRLIYAKQAEDAGDFVDIAHRKIAGNVLRITTRGWFTKDDVKGDFDANHVSGQRASSELWQHKMARVRGGHLGNKEGGSIVGKLGDNNASFIYADYGADREYKNSTLKHINWKGWVDNYRIPKYIYFLTQALYTEKPMIFIQPHFWREQYIGKKKDFVIDSNCDEVELFVNGQSQGKAYPLENEYPTVTFENILIQDGVISAIGRKNGEEVSQKWALPGAPSKILLKAHNSEIPADRSGISVITAYILDENGNLVFDAVNELNWNVSELGKLVGPSQYETDIYKHEEMTGAGYTVAPVSNLVRSSDKAGTITVHVTSPGLEAGEIKIRSVKPKITENDGITQPILFDKVRESVKRIANFKEK